MAELALPVPLHKTFHYRVPAGLNIKPGQRALVPFGPRKLVGMVLSVFEGKSEMPLKDVYSAVDAEPLIPRELLDCALWMSRAFASPVGDCVRAVLPAFVKAQESLPDSPPRPRSPGEAPAFALTRGQEAALRRLSEALSSRRHSVSILFGVPASGKTEVYLRLIRQAVESGGQALFLLPEIALTGPFFEEFSSRVEAPVILWHSRLGARQRRHAWHALKEGRARVAVGARSACLLPLKDLRLVILDEEQDESFKQEGQSPLYHAREVALHRARSHGALAVLGSATPSLEAWQMCRSEAAELLEMPQRVSALSRPPVRLSAKPSPPRCLGPELIAELKLRLERREQAILLVNRRGFSTLVLCSGCGRVQRCPRCGVAMIHHEAEGSGGGVLRCHHCLGQAPWPDKCGGCGKSSVRTLGAGTQKVVSELKTALAGARVLRMDRDSLSAEGRHERRIYEKFLGREADILVGTKLVAKSFHFPDVTLVGVVDADTMLHMPDFRATERTMQMLVQVAGRCGRADKPGTVLLQTMHPDHSAVVAAASGDYNAFVHQELAARLDLGYPPFRSLVRLIWSGKDEQSVGRAAAAGAEALRGSVQGEVVGPAPAVLARLSGKFRHHLLLKAERSALGSVLEKAQALKPPSGVKLKINVDPYDLF
ncbi:MAG: primosomal protein N' [Elusimicrobia bacterium]|nr:primosomal protein N' [Elusimicrobiota bacterium]